MASASLPPDSGRPGSGLHEHRPVQRWPVRRRPGHSTGLYDSQYEHDACGVGFVADLTGERRHDTVASALSVLRNLDHRGAKGADPDSGDGAGILTQMPDELLRSRCDFHLPPAGSYAAGLAFLPTGPDRGAIQADVAQLAASEGLAVLGWRDVPYDPDFCGNEALASLPQLVQLAVAGLAGESGLALDRKAYCLRKRADHELGLYMASLSSRTIVYKGMLTALQLEPFFPDLSDPLYQSAIALVHARFSTNTFPSWPLAHPYRLIAHNGEINTIRGNRNWMRAREAQLAADVLGTDADGRGIERLLPIMDSTVSDSASFDACLELLHLGGRSLPHAVLMMIPEPWENNPHMDRDRREFYRFHASLMEPWDGPALIAFTDGTVIGAVLDRNGLRPGRYWVTTDGLVVLASEVGVLDIDPAQVIRKGRLQPGRIFLADTGAGRIIEDEEVKSALAAEHPYADWLHAGMMHLRDLPDRIRELPDSRVLLVQQQTFGYTEEELRVLLAPMARTGAEPLGSMGSDTPLAVLSDRPRLIYDYFSQLFAQVTNPPLDAIREELVTSLGTATGPEHNLLEPGPASCRQVVLPFPVISDSDLAKIVHINDDGDMQGFAAHVVDGRYEVAGGGDGLMSRLAEIRAEVSAAIAGGARIIVLSDRGAEAGGGPTGGATACAARPDSAPVDDTPGDERLAPIPSLLLTGAVHHHLIAEQTRTMAGLVVESGDARECHHIALLLGFGAAAVCPYLAIESVEEMVRRGTLRDVTEQKAAANLVKALGKGVLKIMSKMGVSTVASYTGAQLFEAVGLGPEVIGSCFAGTSSPLGGIGFEQIAAEVSRRHAVAYPARGGRPHQRLETGGEYQWRRDGEPHLFSPEAVFKLQHATRSGQEHVFREYTRLVDDQSAKLMTLRGLLRIRGIDDSLPGDRTPVPIEEVEPVASIVKRFATGAMSYGSISAEAHETIAIAMNRLGGRSNTGEGGEDARRYVAGRERRSAAVVSQAGRQWALRRDERVPGQRRRPADQDGAGRQARRRRSAAWPQGVSVDRRDPAFHAGRRADLAAAAPRHLLHRGPGAAHPRPEERQPAGAGARQTRGRGRSRHRGGWRVESARRRRADLRAGRGDRCITADQHQACWRAVGTRARRDAADTAAQWPAGPDSRASRRPAEDRPGCDHRGTARRRGVRLRHRAARGGRVRADAGLPSGHLPGRRRHSES